MPVTPKGYTRKYSVKIKNKLIKYENNRLVSGRRKIRRLRDLIKWKINNVRRELYCARIEKTKCILSEKLSRFLVSNKQKGELPKRISKKDLKKMMFRQNKKCCYCSSSISYYNFTIDHIIPVKFGGKTQIGNICLCCSTCNVRKNSKFSFCFKLWIKNLNKKYGKNIFN